MKSRVGIITTDNIFFDKIKMILRADAEVIRISTDHFYPSDYDVIFTDTRNSDIPKCDTVTFGEGCDVSIPFKHEDVLDAFCNSKGAEIEGLVLSDDGKHAYLSGRVINLTKNEYKLLECLMNADIGKFVSKEEILSSVWGDKCDIGVVIVYMCYLRKKLEANGEKVIVTNRHHRDDCSYKIDERYRRKR